MHGTAEQIDAIHAMMESGARSVRLETHTPVLWGLAGAILILVIDDVFTAEQFSVAWQRTLAANAFIGMVLLAVGIVDFRLTRRARLARDESLSFVQTQLTKVWWLVVTLVVLLNIGMNFFGGGYLYYPVVMALIGLAFYIHGLFSQQMLSWAGLLLIFVGAMSIVLGIPFSTQEWLAVVVFGIGLPALGFMIRTTWLQTTTLRRGMTATLWLSLILVCAAMLSGMEQRRAIPDASAVPLQQFQQTKNGDDTLQLVRLPAGTRVPLQLSFAGDILKGDVTAELYLTLSQDLDVMVQNGQPDGRYRVAGGEWKAKRYTFRVKNVDLSSTLTEEKGPEASVRLFLSTDG